LISQVGGAFVVSISPDPHPAPPKNEYYLQERKERMPAPNLIPQGGGAFVRSMPRGIQILLLLNINIIYNNMKR
jgi:hypothetical protein